MFVKCTLILYYKELQQTVELLRTFVFSYIGEHAFQPLLEPLSPEKMSRQISSLVTGFLSSKVSGNLGLQEQSSNDHASPKKSPCQLPLLVMFNWHRNNLQVRLYYMRNVYVRSFIGSSPGRIQSGRDSHVNLNFKQVFGFLNKSLPVLVHNDQYF